MWFFQYAAIRLFNVNPLFFSTGISSASNLITSAIDGLIVGILLGWFKKKELNVNSSALRGKKTMARVNEDRFIVGCLGGIISGIVFSCLNYISFYLFHFAKARYIDAASMMIHGRFADNLPESIVSQISVLIFADSLAFVLSTSYPWFPAGIYILKDGSFRSFPGLCYMRSSPYSKFQGWKKRPGKHRPPT
jgi:hypothetical protein